MVCCPTLIYHIIPEAATIRMANLLNTVNERPTVDASAATCLEFMIENPIPRHIPHPALTTAALREGSRRGINSDTSEIGHASITISENLSRLSIQ
jgi:hypothetical protein